MSIVRNNYAFKGHKTLLGAKYVTYGELELPLRSTIFNLSKSFDWGHNGPAAQQLAFAMLFQLTDDEEFSKTNTLNFTKEIVSKFNRDWIITAFDVAKWIEKNSPEDKLAEKFQKKEQEKDSIVILKSSKTSSSKKTKPKTNVVKDICKKLQITQKDLAKILEIPEGTVSSWAVKNEIPRLGKKAIEFYMQSKKNEEIIESYKSFVKLLNVS